MLLVTHKKEQLREVGSRAIAQGADVKIVGHWLWAKFSAKPAKSTIDAMKANGWKWSASKARWYFVGAINGNRFPKSYKYIRETYGEEELTQENSSLVAA